MNFLFSQKENSSDRVNTNVITPEKKQKILSILNVFETGYPDGDYSNISIFRDGPGGIKQVTYGRSQTTEFGNLHALIKEYSLAGGEYSSELAKYVGRVGQRPSLYTDSEFLRLLKAAGSDPVMHRVQDEFFDEHYWDPAYKFFEQNGFTKPLSMLVIYDSYIHSGSIPSWLRRRFAAVPPAKGGTEEDWISQYLNTRHSWLANHTRRILRKTTYRTRDMKRAIADGDWDLDEPFSANGTIVA